MSAPTWACQLRVYRRPGRQSVDLSATLKRGTSSEEVAGLELEVLGDERGGELACRDVDDQRAGVAEVSQDLVAPAQELRCGRLGVKRERRGPRLGGNQRVDGLVLEDDAQREVPGLKRAHALEEELGGDVVDELGEDDDQGALPELPGELSQ